MATASLGVALATLALAIAGALVWLLDLAPLLAQGMLVVAIGGTILGVTLSAIGLMTTRHRRDPVGRRRAWLGVGISCALLVALLIAFGSGLAGPIVVSSASQVAAAWG